MDTTTNFTSSQTTSPSTPLIFTGKAREYFGIWIVNLLLTICTLGIYSAWAKVRRKKYFYQNTLLDGVGFDYHAKPIAILKGRVIAVILFVLYKVLAGANPFAAIALFLLFSIAVPWLIVRSLTFNARNSSHRGLRFDFSANTAEAAKVFMLYPLLVLITLGLAYPWFLQRVNQFMFNHHRFGLSRFSCEASVQAFYKIYLKFLGLIVALGVVLAIVIGSMTPHAKAESDMDTQLPYTQRQATTQFEMTPEERAEFEQEIQKIRQQSQAQVHAAQGDTPLARSIEALKQANLFAWTVGGLAMFVYVLFLASFTAYIKSRTSNLVWNNTHVDQVTFASSQRMRDVAWLYATNLVALIFTLGLATPWAQIRMARYRLSHLAIVGVTDWQAFVGDKKEAMRATGEEIAEMFDVDISFG